MQITTEHRTRRAGTSAAPRTCRRVSSTRRGGQRTTRLPAPPCELYQAWRAAYDEAALALADWRCVHVTDRADAYAAYRAAADREDAAAEHWLTT